jgi:hypothetical protein
MKGGAAALDLLKDIAGLRGRVRDIYVEDQAARARLSQ